MGSPRLLWGKYFQYERDGEGALLDPVGLDSVYLSREEVDDLLATTPTATHRALAGLGFTPADPPIDRRASLRAHLQLVGVNPMPRRISGLRVVLTDRCNMACSYCFVHTNTGAADMSEKELAAGLTYLFEENAGQDEVSIQWFGGEPTIRFDLIRHGDDLADHLAARHNVRRVRRTVVTNGVRLTDEMLYHYARYGYGVGISIDGQPTVNTANRTLLGGQPADERIHANVRRLLDTEHVHVGCNLTPTVVNLDRLADTVAWIIGELGLKFIYVNTPIPVGGRWLVGGRELARELYRARMVALGKGGMLFSVLDRSFQALDTRRPLLFDHLQANRTLNAALLPGGRVSLCDINFTEPDFVFSIDELRKRPELLGAIAKNVAPLDRCGGCPALAICGGPSRNEQSLIDGGEPDPEMCTFYSSTVEIAIWDSTGLQ